VLASLRLHGGSETIACVTLGLNGNPADPATAFLRSEQEPRTGRLPVTTIDVPNNRGKGIGGGESDRLIVPEKVVMPLEGRRRRMVARSRETPADHGSGETVEAKLLCIAHRRGRTTAWSRVR